MVKRVAWLIALVVIVACGGSSDEAIGGGSGPSITSLSPSSAIVGGAPFVLSVRGSRFTSAAVVRWNGADRETTLVSSSELAALIPAADIAVAGNKSVTVSDSSGVSSAATFAVQSQPFNATQFAGSYRGTWHNETFGSTDASSLDIVVNAATKSGSVTWDLDGNVLGQGNPPAETFNGTYSDNGFTFGGTSATFGNFQITVDAAGRASGFATNPNTAISRVDFTGTVTATSMNIRYTVIFSAAGGGGTATGTVSMTKQ